MRMLSWVMGHPRLRAMQCLALAVVDFALTLHFHLPYLEINPYLARDIRRTQEILGGNMVWAGPDTLSGGYLPGPFFYLTLAPIVAFTANIALVCIYILALRVVSQLGACLFFERVTKVPAYFSYLLLAASPAILRNYTWPTNASMALTLLPILLVSLYCLRLEFSRGKLAGVAVLLGLLIQVHYSFMACWLPIALILWEQKRRWGEYFLSAGCVVIPLVPYLIVRFIQPEQGPHFNDVTSNSEFLLHSFLRSFERISMANLAGNFSPHKVENMLLCSYLIARSIWIGFRGPRDAFSVLCFFLAACGVALAGWIIVDFNARYTMLWHYFALSFLAFDAWRILSKRGRSLQLVALVAIVGLGGVSRVVNYQHSEFRTAIPTLGDFERVCEYFNGQKIGFQTFLNSTYEWDPNESSFYFAKHCFEE